MFKYLKMSIEITMIVRKNVLTLESFLLLLLIIKVCRDVVAGRQDVAQLLRERPSLLNLFHCVIYVKKTGPFA